LDAKAASNCIGVLLQRGAQAVGREGAGARLDGILEQSRSCGQGVLREQGSTRLGENRHAPTSPRPWQTLCPRRGDTFTGDGDACPCGCGESIQMNIFPDAHPCWQVTHHSDGAVSLYPSIRNQSGCKSHFFVRRSRVYWWNRETGDARIPTNTTAGLLQRPARLSRHTPLSSAASHSHRTLA